MGDWDFPGGTVSRPNIDLINPPLSLEARYGVKSQSGGQTPPFGLACLAAASRQRGFPTRIIDAPAQGLDDHAVAALVAERQTAVVGLTAATIAVESAARIARIIRRIWPRALIMIGGAHLTALPEETLARYEEFDLGVIGEGERTLCELLDALANGADVRRVPGLILREGQEYKLLRDEVASGSYVPVSDASGVEGASDRLARTEPRPLIMDLDSLPPPAFDLLPDLAKHYCPPVHTVRRLPAALLVLSRGCPGRCLFCDRSVFGNRLRAWSANYALGLVEELYQRYGIREIQIRDDNFLAFPRRLEEFCVGLIARRLDLTWTCAGRVDMINPERLALMKRAGCWQIWYGIESGSQAILQTVGKGIRLEQIRRAVHATKKAGIQPCGFFILGHPGETPQTLEETISLACRLPLADAHFSFMTPFPGSELYRRVHEFGRFHADWNELNGWRPTFIPRGLSPEDLERASRRAFFSFYFRLRIVLGYLRRVRSIDHMRLYGRGFLALTEFLLRRTIST